MSTPLSARWQPAQDELLRQSWGKISATAIARQIGDTVTKGAVIGRADRLGLPRLNPNIMQRTYNPPKVKSRRSGRRPRTELVNMGFSRVYPPRPKRAAMIEDISTDDMCLISIVELSDVTCRWPIGDPSDWDNFKYCGLPKQTHDGPYCSHHLKKSMMAFEKVFACR